MVNDKLGLRVRPKAKIVISFKKVKTKVNSSIHCCEIKLCFGKIILVDLEGQSQIEECKNLSEKSSFCHKHKYLRRCFWSSFQNCCLEIR